MFQVSRQRLTTQNFTLNVAGIRQENSPCELNGADTRWCIALLNLAVNVSRSQKVTA